MKWPAYPEYKDSGVEWLGEIPAGWDVRRLKTTITACKNGIWGDEPDGTDNDIPCIRVADFDRTLNRVRPGNLTIRSISANDRHGRVLKAGDLLLEKSGGGDQQPVGVIVMYAFDLPAVCSNFIARMPIKEEFDANFLCYLHSTLYSLRINTLSIKQSTGIQNLDANAYLCEKVGIPSLLEQQTIANFLDYQTAKIDTLIAKKNRQIELLKERRIALISRAVTKGLDPTVEMKDSGVEWLGQIPAHWELTRLRFTTSLQTGVTLGKKYDGRTLVRRPYLRVANVQDGFLELSNLTEIDVPIEDVSRYALRPGDVLMTEGGDFDKLGRGYLWSGEIPGCLHQNHIFVVRPTQSTQIDSKHLATVLMSAYAKAYFTSTSQQTTNLACTNSTKIKNFPVPLPPASEQRSIVLQLSEMTLKIDTLIAKIQEHIGKLKEYRTALISAAVTGKIDVRYEAEQSFEDIQALSTAEPVA